LEARLFPLLISSPLPLLCSFPQRKLAAVRPRQSQRSVAMYSFSFSFFFFPFLFFSLPVDIEKDLTNCPNHGIEPKLLSAPLLPPSPHTPLFSLQGIEKKENVLVSEWLDSRFFHPLPPFFLSPSLSFPPSKGKDRYGRPNRCPCRSGFSPLSPFSFSLFRLLWMKKKAKKPADTPASPLLSFFSPPPPFPSHSKMRVLGTKSSPPSFFLLSGRKEVSVKVWVYIFSSFPPSFLFFLFRDN